MCQAECVGDYHRKCNHYVKHYETGVITDCGSPNCGLSAAHAHTTPFQLRHCQCPKTYQENRRVQNLIQEMCDACNAAGWAQLDRENAHRWS